MDWYRTSFAANFRALFWDDGGEEKASLALAMLQPPGKERILDLACATGRRSLELSRRGHDVIGIDIQSDLLSIAGSDATTGDLWPYFIEMDPRHIHFEDEFDIVLSLGGGALEHFEDDDENFIAFEAAARALRAGGRLLMQTPNIIHVEEHLPERTWLEEGESIELLEQMWDPVANRIHGTRRSLIECEMPCEIETDNFERRLYSLEELADVFESVGLALSNVFDEYGVHCAPSDVQQELFVEARK